MQYSLLQVWRFSRENFFRLCELSRQVKLNGKADITVGLNNIAQRKGTTGTLKPCVSLGILYYLLHANRHCFDFFPQVVGFRTSYAIYSRKNEVEELQTDPKDSRLPTWLGCFDCQQADGYPKTDFFIYRVKILPTYPVT